MDGRNESGVTSATLEAVPFFSNAQTPRAKAVIPLPTDERNCPIQMIKNLIIDRLPVGLGIKNPSLHSFSSHSY